MKIKVFQQADGNWRADPCELPGSPINGIGKNRWEAVGSLLFAIRHEKGFVSEKWPAISIVNERDEEFPAYSTEGIDE